MLFRNSNQREKNPTTSLPVVSLKDIKRCQSKNSKSWICLTVCVQGLCLQSSPKQTPPFLHFLFWSLGASDVLSCLAATQLCLPKAREKKKSLTRTFWQLFVSKRAELCLLLAILWFLWMWWWPGFPNPCPSQAASQGSPSHPYLPLIPWSCAQFGPHLRF